MGSIWDDMKRTLKEGVNVADDYRKIGKIKIDILNLNRNMEKQYVEMGKTVQSQIKDGKKASLKISASMRSIASDISDIQKSIDKKKKEIEQIKKEADAKSSKKKTKKPSEKSAAPKTTPKKPEKATVTKKAAPKKAKSGSASSK